MTNLTTVSGTPLQSSASNSEVTVNTYTGEAYISQRKAAELLGVARPSLQSYIERNLHPVNSELEQGLSSEIFANTIQYYALDARNPTAEAKTLLKQITQAGTKAYLYHLAGYTMGVQQPKPAMTKQELLEDIKLDTKIEAERVKQAALKDKARASQLKLQALRDKLAKQSEVLHAKTTAILARGAKIKGDMVVGKLDLPTDCITELLKQHGSDIEPKFANWALRKLGYLTVDNKVTELGLPFGKTIKASPKAKTTLARWYVNEFSELLNQITEVYDSEFNI